MFMQLVVKMKNGAVAEVPKKTEPNANASSARGSVFWFIRLKKKQEPKYIITRM
jgi:hypothetical protein